MKAQGDLGSLGDAKTAQIYANDCHATNVHHLITHCKTSSLSPSSDATYGVQAKIRQSAGRALFIYERDHVSLDSTKHRGGEEDDDGVGGLA